jgi:hypothetical protein
MRRLVGVSAVLAVLRLEEALAQFVGKADNADGDEVVLECARCPGSGAGQERGCGQRVAQAQDELGPRVDGGCYPGQLEGIGQNLVLLRALRRPWCAQHSARTVRLLSAPSTWTRSPDGTAMVAGSSSRPSCEPRRSSITRSAPRCSAESPAGTASYAAAAGLADAPILETAALASPGMLPGSWHSRSRSMARANFHLLAPRRCRRQRGGEFLLTFLEKYPRMVTKGYGRFQPDLCAVPGSLDCYQPLPGTWSRYPA